MGGDGIDCSSVESWLPRLSTSLPPPHMPRAMATLESPVRKIACVYVCVCSHAQAGSHLNEDPESKVQFAKVPSAEDASPLKTPA
jgi:hypothetical protein